MDSFTSSLPPFKETPMPQSEQTMDRSYNLPPLGDNPSTDRQGTTPG